MSRLIGIIAAVSLAALGVVPAVAAPAALGETQQQAVNPIAIVMFLIFVISTLGITYWASKRTKTTSDFMRRAEASAERRMV